MENKIFINFNRIDDDLSLYLIDNTIDITIKEYDDIIVFQNNYQVNYHIDDTINVKKYYISIELEIKPKLKTDNFTITLVKNFNYEYNYYKNELEKSIIIYKKYNNIPLIYLGLPNAKSYETFKIIYKFKSLLSDTSFGDYTCSSTCDDENYNGINTSYITMFNNYFGNSNFLLNTLQLSGFVYEICLSNTDGITSYDDETNSNINYELFKISSNIEIDFNTNIYFTNIPNKLFPNILYLNTYNYVNIKNTPDDNEILILQINYNDSQTNTNTNTENYVYSSILSLNLQTFNPLKLCDVVDNFDKLYYNTLFFYNYINSNYYVDVINMFDYDFNKYFQNTKTPIELNYINSYQYSLYDNIIANDQNLKNPIILNIERSWVFMNFDFINLTKKLINPLAIMENFYKFTQSKKFNLESIIDYLANFTIKKYNVFKIDNINFNWDDKNNNHNKNTKIKNYLYNYESKYNYSPVNSNLNINLNNNINFNNNLVNCIKCKIDFYYKSNTNFKLNGIYSLDAKLFLSNYNLEIYHKEYNFENQADNEEKKKLIKLLLFLCTTTYQINISFYNKKNSFIPSFNLFNKIGLINNDDIVNITNIENNNFEMTININPLNNEYTDGYLKLNLQVRKDYYILFLYADKNTFLNSSNYNELIFMFDVYTFKIFKIDEPNGNQYENKLLFYISFNDLKELNIFMKFIETGRFYPNEINLILSNYFNIKKSIEFCNYYELNNYWVSFDTSIPMKQTINKNIIFFSINNLTVNQIYLYGELFIECL